jgi:hypothetical protein
LEGGCAHALLWRRVRPTYAVAEGFYWVASDNAPNVLEVRTRRIITQRIEANPIRGATGRIAAFLGFEIINGGQTCFI